MTTYDSNYAYNMATQLAQYDTQYSYSRLDRNKTNYTAQQTAINSLSSALSTFQTKLSGLNSVSGSILQNKATLSSEGYATADVTSKAQAGSYQFFVKQLAGKDQYVVQDLSQTGTLRIGQPENTKDVDGSPTPKGTIEIDLTAEAFKNEKDELDLGKVAAAVNAQAKEKELGITATLVRSGGTVNLVLTSEETGSAQRLEVDLGDTGATKTQLSSAQDAEVYLGNPVFVDGVIDETQSFKLTNTSNVFNNIIEGVSLTFSKVHKEGDAPLALDIAQDNEGTKAKVQEFVDAYNALAGELKKLTASGSEDSKRGPLAGDGTVRSIKSMIDNMIRKGVNVDGQQVSLVSLGISNTREGTLTLDSARLEKTLAANPGALDALFKGTGGTEKGILGSLLDRESGLAKYTSSVNGILKNRKDSIADSLKRIDRERERVDTQYDNLYQRYLAQYTNLVTIMNQMSQTSSLYFT